MAERVLHQLSVGATPGDAITDELFLFRRWLRARGFDSEIYAEHVNPTLEQEVHAIRQYRPRHEGELVIFHHSIGSPVVDWLVAQPVRIVLVYHNVTPPHFFADVDPSLARQMADGRRQLDLLRPKTVVALGKSAYSERELQEVGFEATGVLPLSIDAEQYDRPLNPDIVADMRRLGPNLLSVGRLVPNKKQDDVIKLLYYYRRIAPDARLFLVGSHWVPTYVRWLEELTADLCLRDAVVFTNHVSRQDLVTYYRTADVYVSMSEHEGFGKPLIESMYLDLPVLAYAASAIPDTLGGAGILFHHKAYEALAELIDMVVGDTELRRKLVRKQRARARCFLRDEVRQRFYAFVDTLDVTDA